MPAQVKSNCNCSRDRVGCRLVTEVAERWTGPRSVATLLKVLVTFVLPWRAKNGHHALASSLLGASRELHLTLFPQGKPRPGLTSQK
jgi:hypothetical protein